MSLAVQVSVVCVRLLVFVCLDAGLQVKLAVMAAQSSREQCGRQLHSLDLSPSQQGDGLGWGGLGVGRLQGREGGTDKISVCLAVGCRRRVSWARSPDPHPATRFHRRPPPQSAMEGWFAEGGGARPVSSAPRQPALSGLHWGLLLLNYGGAPLGPISNRKSGRQAFTWLLKCDPFPRLYLLPHVKFLLQPHSVNQPLFASPF